MKLYSILYYFYLESEAQFFPGGFDKFPIPEGLPSFTNQTDFSGFLTSTPAVDSEETTTPLAQE